MIELEATARRSGDVTVVRVTLANSRSTPQTVRLESRLNGPVWPPRRDGVVDPRWEGDVWEATVRPRRCRGIGFASPAAPVDPPVELLACERSDPEETSPSPSEIVGSLDGWSPAGEVLELER